MKTAGDERWFSSERAARYLGVQQRTLYRLIDTGELPAYRIGRVIRVQAADVDAFIESHRIQRGDLSRSSTGTTP